MGDRPIEDDLARLERRLGPHVHAFAEYASGELWRRVTRCALDAGLTSIEAEMVAALTVKAAVKTIAGGIQQARWDRMAKMKG